MQKNRGIIHIFLIVLGIFVCLLLLGFFTSQQNLNKTKDIIKIDN